MTVYTTFITGPTPGHEMHIILVDNGRRMMRAIPEFVEALHCIRCGACANVCPPYCRSQRARLRAYLHRRDRAGRDAGFITGSMRSPSRRVSVSPAMPAKSFARSRIPLPRQILDVRKMVVENGLSPIKRVVLAVYSRPDAFDIATESGPVPRLPLARDRHDSRASLPKIGRQTRWRSMPALAAKPLRDRVTAGHSMRRSRRSSRTGRQGNRWRCFPAA